MSHRGARRPAASALAVIALVITALVALAPDAQAHDVLLSTSPADASTVATAPAQVVLTFDAPAFAIGTQILINGPGGNVAVGKPRLINHQVMQSLAPGAPAGPYTVLWRVTSADGHPVSGSFTFTATAASTATATAATPVNSTGSATHGRSFGPLAWVAIAVVVALLWGGAVVGLRRRRSRSKTDKAADQTAAQTADQA
jgi:methionine-rich copper-binding protein CopC